MIESVGDLYGDRVAFRYKVNPRDKECETKCYIQLRDDVRALATEFLARGYKGKHVVVLGKQSYPWILTYFATLAMGAVLVPLDKDWGAAELADTVKTADASIIFCDKDQEGKLSEICSVAGVNTVFFLDGEEGETLEALLAAGREKFKANSSPYHENVINPEILSLLVFTSGTTGKGKGVMLSQHNFCSDLADVIPYIDFSVRTLNVLPPHHTYGSSVSIYGQCCIGCDIYISSGIKYILKELQEHKPGHLVAVPLYVETFYRRIVAGIEATGKEKLIYTLMKVSNALRKVGIDIRRKLFGKILEPFGGELNMIISGGAPLNQDVADLFDSIGVTVINGYGITECAPIIAVNHNHYIVPKSVGPVLPIDDVKIFEPNEEGEGEILVKGPNIMLGYYKNDEATAEAFDEEGYFRTGDYGKMTYDKSNNNRVLYITGRKKNLIILANGKNVYPEEIEDALSATPGVIDLIAYEGKSKRGDTFNTIVLEVYPDKDFIKKNNIEDFKSYFQTFVDEYNKTATPYKKIGFVKVRDEEFPKNTLRKILRFKLDMTID
jgi:long-chain acyl-CoA synthetase